MNANEVAKAAGIGKDTLRYYEKIGLISIPPRGQNGYRQYPASVLDELRFIRLGQSVGFTLNEIKPAIPFIQNPKPDCPLLKNAIASQIQRIEDKMRELKQSRETLMRWQQKLEQHPVNATS